MVQNDKMDIGLTRKFIDPVKLQKHHEKYMMDYSGTEADDETLRCELMTSIECQDISSGSMLISLENELGYFTVSYSPSQEEILSLVEQQEALSGDLLVKVIEMVVKKLNKFKALIESIKGV